MEWIVERNLDLRYVVIGAGMSGILAAIRLRDSGCRNVTLLEKAQTVGGTWRENRYPGLNCDVPAHAYTYSFAPNAEWSSYLAPGHEIQDYFERVTADYRLRDIAHFGQEVESCVYAEGAWRIATKAGMTCEADIVITATGVLHHPRMPDIAGLDDFAGTVAHSARWDESIPLDGRRIGVVGNGSTGVQLVSALGGRAGKLSHFQRSPQWIMPVLNEPYDEAQREAFRRDPALIDAIRYDPEYLANVLRFTEGIIKPDSEEMQIIEAMVLGYLEQGVTDPVLREKLRPDYRAACKRLIFSPDYYQVVQEHDVDIVVGGIDRIEPEGIRTRDGVLHELDLIILATGFHSDRFIRPAVVTGRGGVALDDVWRKHATAYNAISLPDFPNFLFLNGPTGPVGNFSLIDVAERQWGYVEQLLDKVATGECDEISVSADAMARYEDARIAAAKGTIFASGCSSWYLGKDGVPMTWPWSYGRFAEVMAKPDFDDFEMVKAEVAA
jgi:cation diffusion facilitator CzcD-associated flavoprotein CzcO